MNIVTLIGNIATDVEKRQDGGHRSVMFCLSVDRREGGEDVFTVIADDKTDVMPGLRKGRRIAIDGQIRTSVTEDEPPVYVAARRVELLRARP